ncbi:BREX system ATP-binding domain-containing protein [Deinococcus aluminii]|uniref:BREX system ATP-binding domain-containing protein n=1 Tax=Deinococcus aluminii TaxID=1656885 RepID=UPI0031EE1EF1
MEVMGRVRHIWEVAQGVTSRLPEGFEGMLAQGWTTRLGSRSPRIVIREFVGVLDRLHDYPEFDPFVEYSFDLPAEAFSSEERGDGVWEPLPEDVF